MMEIDSPHPQELYSLWKRFCVNNSYVKARTERQIAPPASPDKPKERQKTTTTPTAPRPARPVQNDTAPVIPERKRAAPVVKESNFTIRRTTARKEWIKTVTAASKQKKGEKP